MQLNITFDQSQASLPAGFVAGVNYVVNYFDSVFTSPVTVNINVGYGEIAGQPLGNGALGESETYIDNSFDYAQIVNALNANAVSAKQKAAYATLPASSPLPSATLWLTTSQEKALGLLDANDPSIDGYVGFSSVYPFDYSTNSAAAGTYYFVGVVEHEFSEIMGRDSFLGDTIAGAASYSLMDLF